MTITTGERQYGQLDEIRKDHLARYEFVTELLSKDDEVLDAACGCGYGSYLMADKAKLVMGLDNNDEALRYAMTNYCRKNTLYYPTNLPDDNLNKFDFAPYNFDVITCFETIEHVENPLEMLKHFKLGWKDTTRLFASVPNQNRIQFDPKRFPFHHRHYTKDEFGELLSEAGWTVKQWYGQEDAWGDVKENVNGRTLVVECV